MHPYVGEFIGTLLLILLGDGVVANVVLPKTKGHDGGWIVITLGWGMAVFVAVWCVGPVSGAHLNPAVTLGLALSPGQEFGWGDVPGYIAAQMAGAVAGASLVFAMYRDHFALCDDPAAKQAVFCNAPAVANTPRNLLSEAVGTGVLVLAVLLVAAPEFTIGPPPTGGEAAAAAPTPVGLGTLGALPVGLLVLAIGLSLGGTTGYAINPARDLGPRIAHAILPIPGKGPSGWGYSWIPVVGPLLGGAGAALLHRFLW